MRRRRSPVQTVTATRHRHAAQTVSNVGATGTASGFFLQDPSADADPNTSEGIFVFTSSVADGRRGRQVTVTGTVAEFNGLTEIRHGHQHHCQ